MVTSLPVSCDSLHSTGACSLSLSNSDDSEFLCDAYLNHAHTCSTATEGPPSLLELVTGNIDTGKDKEQLTPSVSSAAAQEERHKTQQSPANTHERWPYSLHSTGACSLSLSNSDDSEFLCDAYLHHAHTCSTATEDPPSLLELVTGSGNVKTGKDQEQPTLSASSAAAQEPHKTQQSPANTHERWP